jgi:hypothetical protein
LIFIYDFLSSGKALSSVGVLCISISIFMQGCGTPDTPPANFWGGVGFMYEAQKGGGVRRGPTATASFEKELGNGFGVGGEVAVPATGR